MIGVERVVRFARGVAWLGLGGCVWAERAQAPEAPDPLAHVAAQGSVAVRGTVYAAPDRRTPLAGAVVWALGADVVATTDAAGRFEVDLPAGPEWLFVSGPDGVQWGWDVLVGSDEELALHTSPYEPVWAAARSLGSHFLVLKGLLQVRFDGPGAMGGEVATPSADYELSTSGYDLVGSATVTGATFPTPEQLEGEPTGVGTISFWNTRPGVVPVRVVDGSGRACSPRHAAFEEVPVLPYSITSVRYVCPDGAVGP